MRPRSFPPRTRFHPDGELAALVPKSARSRGQVLDQRNESSYGCASVRGVARQLQIREVSTLDAHTVEGHSRRLLAHAGALDGEFLPCFSLVAVGASIAR